MGITSAALSAFRALVAASFKYLAVGETATAFSISQTALASEITGNGLERAEATVSAETTAYTDDTVRLTHTWTVTGAEIVREIATFDAASGGNMGVRKITDSAYSLETDDTFTYELDTIFTYQT